MEGREGAAGMTATRRQDADGATRGADAAVAWLGALSCFHGRFRGETVAPGVAGTQADQAVQAMAAQRAAEGPAPCPAPPPPSRPTCPRATHPRPPKGVRPGPGGGHSSPRHGLQAGRGCGRRAHGQ